MTVVVEVRRECCAQLCYERHVAIAVHVRNLQRVEENRKPVSRKSQASHVNGAVLLHLRDEGQWVGDICSGDARYKPVNEIYNSLKKLEKVASLA